MAEAFKAIALDYYDHVAIGATGDSVPLSTLNNILRSGYAFIYQKNTEDLSSLMVFPDVKHDLSMPDLKILLKYLFNQLRNQYLCTSTRTVCTILIDRREGTWKSVKYNLDFIQIVSLPKSVSSIYILSPKSPFQRTLERKYMEIFKDYQYEVICCNQIDKLPQVIDVTNVMQFNVHGWATCLMNEAYLGTKINAFLATVSDFEHRLQVFHRDLWKFSNFDRAAILSVQLAEYDLVWTQLEDSKICADEIRPCHSEFNPRCSCIDKPSFKNIQSLFEQKQANLERQWRAHIEFAAQLLPQEKRDSWTEIDFDLYQYCGALRECKDHESVNHPPSNTVGTMTEVLTPSNSRENMGKPRLRVSLRGRSRNKIVANETFEMNDFKENSLIEGHVGECENSESGSKDSIRCEIETNISSRKIAESTEYNLEFKHETDKLTPIPLNDAGINCNKVATIILSSEQELKLTRTTGTETSGALFADMSTSTIDLFSSTMVDSTLAENEHELEIHSINSQLNDSKNSISKPNASQGKDSSHHSDRVTNYFDKRHSTGNVEEVQQPGMYANFNELPEGENIPQIPFRRQKSLPSRFILSKLSGSRKRNISCERISTKLRALSKLNKTSPTGESNKVKAFPSQKQMFNVMYHNNEKLTVDARPAKIDNKYDIKRNMIIDVKDNDSNCAVDAYIATRRKTNFILNEILYTERVYSEELDSILEHYNIDAILNNLRTEKAHSLNASADNSNLNNVIEANSAKPSSTNLNEHNNFSNGYNVSDQKSQIAISPGTCRPGGSNLEIQSDGVIGSVQLIFGNLSDIAQFHREHLLPQLIDSSCLSEGLPRYEGVADVLANCVAVLQPLYSDYCINKPKSDSARMKLETCSNILKICQKSAGHHLPLSAYLLKPVQRITKYQLLLKELEDATNNAVVRKALSSMLSVAAAVNKAVLISQIIGYKTAISTLGNLLIHSDFSVWGIRQADDEAKGTVVGGLNRVRRTARAQSRIVFLFESAVLFCKRRNQPDSIQENKEYFQVKTYLTRDGMRHSRFVRGNELKFELWGPERIDVYIIQAPNMDIKERWLDLLLVCGSQEFKQTSTGESQKFEKPSRWTSDDMLETDNPKQAFLRFRSTRQLTRPSSIPLILDPSETGNVQQKATTPGGIKSAELDEACVSKESPCLSLKSHTEGVDV